MRSCCVSCGGYLQGRAHPARRWGTWCCRCFSWWPDPDDTSRADTDQPARLTLRDGRDPVVQPAAPAR